eukprot:gene2643-1641_t
MYPNTQHPVGSIDSHEINHIQLTQSFKQPHNTIATQTKISPTHQSLKSPHKPTPQPSPIYNRPPIHQTHQNYTSNCNSHTNHILKQRYTVSSLSPYKYMTVLAVATTFNPVSISHEQLQLHPKFKPTIKPDPHKCVQTQSTQHPESARTTSYKPNSNPAIAIHALPINLRNEPHSYLINQCIRKTKTLKQPATPNTQTHSQDPLATLTCRHRYPNRYSQHSLNESIAQLNANEN